MESFSTVLLTEYANSLLAEVDERVQDAQQKREPITSDEARLAVLESIVGGMPAIEYFIKRIEQGERCEDVFHAVLTGIDNAALVMAELESHNDGSAVFYALDI